jgi:hypothetical protein
VFTSTPTLRRLAAVGTAVAAMASAAPLAAARSQSEGLSYAQASVNHRDVTRLFIAAANRGDYMTACSLYSRRYLKVTRAECARFYRWGRRLYGPYDYGEVSRHKLGDKTRVELTHFAWRSKSYIDVQGGKIVGGGW